MAVFRIERTHDYTVMSNYHLKDKRLSLKAKGLLSQMLSLPDDWDYTLAGLCHINRESKDAIRTALQELEKTGYLHRRQTTDASGRFGSNEYIINERPVSDTTTPSSENPSTGKTSTGNPTQLNTNKQNTNLSNTDLIKPSLPASPPPTAGDGEGKGRERTKRAEVSVSQEDYERTRAQIQENLSCNMLVNDYGVSEETLDEIVELVTEIVAIPRTSVRISGVEYPYQTVRDRLLKLNMFHVQYVLDCMSQNTTQVRNAKQYLTAVLFNAPATMGTHTMSQVQHDMCS